MGRARRRSHGANIQAINEKIRSESAFVDRLVGEVGKVIVGQKAMIERVLIGLLWQRATCCSKEYRAGQDHDHQDPDRYHCRRLQAHPVHPRLAARRPGGHHVYNQKTGDFSPKLGPVFTNFVLADEINRAPAKVQSGVASSACRSIRSPWGIILTSLPDPFIVLATQNPIEQEGTYPLPEAQVDRFMLKVKGGLSLPGRRASDHVADDQCRLPAGLQGGGPGGHQARPGACPRGLRR